METFYAVAQLPPETGEYNARLAKSLVDAVFQQVAACGKNPTDGVLTMGTAEDKSRYLASWTANEQ